jgi:hypothetical protein
MGGGGMLQGKTERKYGRVQCLFLRRFLVSQNYAHFLPEPKAKAFILYVDTKKGVKIGPFLTRLFYGI